MIGASFRSKRARRILVIVSALVIVAVLATQTGLASLAQGLAQAIQAQGPNPPTMVEPLTDLAGPQPAVDVRPEESPEERLKAMGLAELDSYSPVLPSGAALEGMDLARPPQWTETLAEPGAPVPPDPYQAPPMAIDPETGQAAKPIAPAVEPQPAVELQPAIEAGADK